MKALVLRYKKVYCPLFERMEKGRIYKIVRLLKRSEGRFEIRLFQAALLLQQSILLDLAKGDLATPCVRVPGDVIFRSLMR
jgi:hypothetical protein